MIDKDNRYKNIYPLIYLSYLFLVIFMTWRVIISPGTIGFVHDWSFANSREELILGWQNFWYAFSPKNLGSFTSYITSYPYFLVQTLLSVIGFGGGLQSKFWLVFPILLSPFSLFFFSNSCFDIKLYCYDKEI